MQYMLKCEKTQLLTREVYCLQLKTVESYGKIWKSNVLLAKVVVSVFLKCNTKNYLATFENVVYGMCMIIVSD